MNTDKISILKRTLGKDGKYYYHESSEYLDKVSEANWHRTSEDFYTFTVNRYKDKAHRLIKDDNGDVIYIEYKVALIGSSELVKKDNLGCILLSLFTVSVFIVVLIIYFIF